VSVTNELPKKEAQMPETADVRLKRALDLLEKVVLSGYGYESDDSLKVHIHQDTARAIHGLIQSEKKLAKVSA
jgi:hypothetical protein